MFNSWQLIEIFKKILHEVICKLDLPCRLMAHQSLKSSCMRACLVAQSCPALCGPVDYSLPGPSVHGILQARILEWVAIRSLGDLPDPGIKPGSSVLQEDSLPAEPRGKPHQWLSLKNYIMGQHPSTVFYVLHIALCLRVFRTVPEPVFWSR